MKTTTKKDTNKYTEFTGIAFSTCDVPRLHDVLVTESGEVLVWDSCGNMYTSCHAISDSDQDKIRKSVGR